ncbi:MAG: pyridoxal phosphate-dependent aminotransferase [Oligoflexia bacterium]|nr:pyridoxal phosphate-dependent aminotransferase [Oligoflexia bacterium]
MGQTQIPIPRQIIDEKLKNMSLPDIGRASIREIKKLTDQLEQQNGFKFIRMEMGVPGLKPNKLFAEAEIDAIVNKGLTGTYPDIDGTPELKKEISSFIKNFMNINISPANCVPTVGSIHGGFASVLVSCRRYTNRDTHLFLDPGFPVHKQMVKMMGVKQQSLDVYNYRGKKLKDKLEELLSQGNISSILYSNPNNPTWICFTEEELKIIGEAATRHDVVIIEDLAYFAMDFRRDYSQPGKAPFCPSVANYTDNYIILISSSKAFSYPGQRIGMLALSDTLALKHYPDLEKFFPKTQFAHSLIYGAIYATTAGTSHTAQYALATVLREVNSGRYNFLNDVREYGEKAKVIKNHFLYNGFKIVYDKDGEEDIADGFYFTFCYPGFSGQELAQTLIYYGISAISLANTGATRTEGVRACISLISWEQIPELGKRLQKFKEDHKTN